MAQFKLFCFPYAGGSARFYKRWQQYLPPEIEIIPIDPPGRGRRFGQKFSESVDEMVEDIFEQVKDQLIDTDYAFFGHSMGAIMSQELTYKVMDSGLPAPLHLFLSGRGAPHIEDEDDEKTYLLPDDQFKAKLQKYGGTPTEILENPELMDIFIPILRADFKVCDIYEHSEREPFDCGITSFSGLEEKLTDEQVQGWQQYTKRKLKINKFPGGHFFIHDDKNTINILRIVGRTIFNIVEERPDRQVG
ncbi:MAG: thioesterase [Halanaerobiales bacterium]|nr:thioesterase [Halanaerobiales bacterium]